MNQPLMLVVDDEPGVRQSLQLVFNKMYRVIEATAADEAIQKVTDERPDVVLQIGNTATLGAIVELLASAAARPAPSVTPPADLAC